jgi:adenylate cyclase
VVDGLSSEQLRPWLLPAVYERHQAGMGEFLTELRPVVALFLRFGGIDYDTDLDAGSKLDTFIRRIQQILARYDGTLLQLTIGDKGSYLYAAFGAPTAHEDDARRAAHAALEWRALPDELTFLQPLQIGISRGVMATGACGSSTRRAYAAMGDEVNLAARLMSRAAPGEILISGRAQTALAAAFELEPLEPIALKGMPEPLPIFRLAGAALRTIRVTEPSYSLPMVGRTAELALVDEKLTLALRTHGQIIGITAEAGMGKSRLLAEVLRIARRKRLRAFGGACQSYGINTPYLVWGPIWRAFFDLDPEWPLRKQIRMLEGGVEDLAPDRLNSLPLLGPLLGLRLPDNDFTQALDPRSRESALHALLLDCLQAAARQAAADGTGLLLVLEDLHWIDALSHDLLENIARAIEDLPVLIVAAYRPPELLRLQAPRIENLEHFTQIALAPVTPVEAGQIIRAKLAQLLPERKGAATPALIERITAKAQGNPFYVEELLNYLRDRGINPQDAAAIESLDLPTSLHTLLLSRIDQLSERERAAIKVASVVGRLFRFADLHGAYPVLGDAALLRDDLDALAKLDLTPLDTPEPELAYLFKHIVTQEVAYQSLTAQARASLHEQLAAYLEQLAGEDTDQYVDLLAYHYDRSNNLDKQRYFLRRAGEAAAARFANDAAVDYLTRALAATLENDLAAQYALVLLREEVEALQAARSAQRQDVEALARLAELLDDDARRSEAATRWARYAEQMGDYAQAIPLARKAVALAQQANHLALEGAAQFQLGWNLWRSDDYVAASAPLEQSLRLARKLGDQRLESNVLGSMGVVADLQGDNASSRLYYEQAITLARACGHRQQEGWALHDLGLIAGEQGDYTSAHAYLEQSLHIFRAIGDRTTEVSAIAGLGRVAFGQGDVVAMQRYFEQSLQLLRITGELHTNGAIWLFYSWGWAMQCLGDYPTARVYYELALARRINNYNHFESSSLSNGLGTLARNQGNLSEAQSWYKQAVDSALVASVRQPEGIGLWGLGNVALDSGELDTALEMYRAAVAVFEAGEHPARVIEAVAGLAAVALARNDSAQAKEHVETILNYLAHNTLTTDNAEEPLRIELICYQVLQALGDPRALAVLESAYERLQQQAAKILDPALQRSFLENVSHHREIVAAWQAYHSY